MKRDEYYVYKKILIFLLFFIFSLVLGILLESIRYHVVGYYDILKFGAPKPTELVMKIHSNSSDYFPQYHSFIDIMLIPCFYILLLNCKSFFRNSGKIRLILHCLLAMMFNLTLAVIFILLMADPICKVGLLPGGDSKASLTAYCLNWSKWILILANIVFLIYFYSKKHTKKESQTRIRER